MNDNIEVFAKFFLTLVAVFAFFWMVHVCFHMMSMRSTLANSIGTAILALLIAGLLIFINKKAKSK